MRLNTIVTLGASAAFGIMAVILARGWINEAIESEFRDTRPAVAVTTQKTTLTTPVVIAANDLSFGDELNRNALRIAEYPEDAVPLGSYRSMEDIFTDISKRTVVLSQMRSNEPLMDYKISGPGGKGSLSARITEGYRAAAIPVDDITGVAGFIVPGDFVDVIYSYNPKTSREENELTAKVLLQNVKVLGIDQNQNENSSTANIARTVTVEVKNEDAQRLHLAHDKGTLSLTLRAAGEKILEPTLTVKTSQLEQTSMSRWTAKPKATASESSKTGNLAEVTIIRGETRDQVKVISENTTLELAGG